MHLVWANLPSGVRMQWVVVSFLNAIIVGPLGPFLGPNIVVPIAGGYRGLNDAILISSVVAGVVTLGFLIGILEWSILRRNLASTSRWVKFSTIGGFLIGALLSFVGYSLSAAGLYGLFVPFCLGGLLIWGLGLCIPLLLPRTWRLF